MKRILFATLAFAGALAASLSAAQYDDMDYGPFISHTYQLPNGNITLRGIAVPFDAPIDGDVIPPKEPPVKGKKPAPATSPAKCGIVFDTELLRYSGYWNGGFITWNGVVFNGSHGGNPSPVGKILATTNTTTGWAKSVKEMVDPRDYPHNPMPREVGRYKGLHRHDKGVVFSYTVGDSTVLDMPNVEVHNKQRVFVRVLNLSPAKDDRFMLVADLPGKSGKAVDINAVATLNDGKDAIIGNIVGGPKGTEFVPGTRLIVKIPASAEPVQLTVGVWGGPNGDSEAAKIALQGITKPSDLTVHTKGGKARFPETTVTQGKRGDDKTAYTVDTLTPPFNNAYKSWMRIGGLDFFADGRAAVSTWSGDVWIVSGIDDKLEKLTWKRYAAGLFHSLGLKIVNDTVYVLGRDQITRLHDVNNDGEADFYECFNNEAMITTNFHEFTFDLHTDPEGNFYFIKGGPVRGGGRGWEKVTPHHGCVFKVSKDGSKLDVVARGFRAPNGMGVGPNGEITTGDNEGTWTPTCPLNWIKPGGFYGVPDFVPTKEKPKIRDNPLCWMPHNEVDNSNGGQVWITGKDFGPLSGQLLHASYGKCRLYSVMKEEVAGQMQGGVTPILPAFDTGICRMRFHEKHNALYVAGLRGWQTTASKDAGLYRVRYTGKKANLPVELKAKQGELAITFSDPLDPKTANDVENFNLEQWNYRWTENYGSPQIKVSDPKKQGHDPVEVQSASLSADGKTVTLKIDNLRPVMQMKIQYNLKTADGSTAKSAIWNTLNVVGNQRGEVHIGEYRVVDTKK